MRAYTRSRSHTYTRTHIDTHKCTHTYTRTRLETHTHTHILRRHAHTCTHAIAHYELHTQVCMNAHKSTHTHTHTHAHPRIYTHARTHTHAPTLRTSHRNHANARACHSTYRLWRGNCRLICRTWILMFRLLWMHLSIGLHLRSSSWSLDQEVFQNFYYYFVNFIKYLWRVKTGNANTAQISCGPTKHLTPIIDDVKRQCSQREKIDETAFFGTVNAQISGSYIGSNGNSGDLCSQLFFGYSEPAPSTTCIE